MSAERLGRYRLGAKLGEGGTAEVFAGVAEGAAGFAKEVAIKRLRGPLASTQELRAQLIAEAEIAKRLVHGNIVQVLDLGVDDEERPYMVVELIDGVPLSALLDDADARDERLPIADALYVADQLLAALDYAHSLSDPDGAAAGVIHRDVKPANILVSRDGLIKLGDFGLARPAQIAGPTSPGIVKGTIGYLSPEQAAAGTIDARTDQFSAGIVIHEMLAGKHPLARSAGGLFDYIRALESGVPALEPAGEVDQELAAIVGRAVAIDRGDRYPDVASFRRALEEWWLARGLRPAPAGTRERVRRLRGEATRARRPLDEALVDPLAGTVQTVSSSPARRSRRDSRWAIAAAVVALAGAIAAIGWLVSERDGGERAEGPAAVADAAVDQAPVDAAPKPADAAPPPVDAARSVDARPIEKPKARPGRLEVNTVPHAQVTVDGRRRGGVPVSIDLPPGRHTVILENRGLGMRATRRVVIKSGKTTQITGWPESARP